MLTAFAAIGSAATPAGAEGNSQGGTDQPRRIELGVKPSLAAAGAVILPRSRSLFAAFPAMGERGDETAVVDFSNCIAWRSRAIGDEEFAPHPVISDALAPCEIYEVENSSWAAVHQEPRQPSPRHFIITFDGAVPGVTGRGRHFECLASDAAAVSFANSAFEHVLSQYIEVMAS